MIKFFRKIRQKMLTENQFSKYLIYAIGEIILVVIGILIALQINNWNQNRVERNKEKLILTELIVDLEEQSKILENYIEIESSFYQNGKDVLRHFSANQTFHGNDSVYAKLNSLVTRKTFNPIITTFQELISTGTIDIIQDKSTKKKIIRYYNELERISMVIGNNNTNIIDAIYQPKVLKQTLFILDKNNSELKEMNDTIFDEKALSTVRKISKKILTASENTLHMFNILVQRTSIAEYHMESYKTLQFETEKLLSEIKNQINEQ